MNLDTRTAERNDSGLRMLTVVVHDVAPSTWPACQHVIAAIEEVAPIPLTLLVVPNYHHHGSDPAFERAIDERRRKGDELVLHGYTHLDDKPCHGICDTVMRRLYTRGEGEFSALDHGEAIDRLRRGIRWFRARGWPVESFVAPAWLLNQQSWTALRRSPFRYTATLSHFHALPRGPALRSQALVYSSGAAWRRMVSLLWVRLVLAALGGRHAQFPIARVELHPHDADYPAIRASFQHLISTLLRDRIAATMSGALHSWSTAGSHRR